MSQGDGGEWSPNPPVAPCAPLPPTGPCPKSPPLAAARAGSADIRATCRIAMGEPRSVRSSRPAAGFVTLVLYPRVVVVKVVCRGASDGLLGGPQLHRIPTTALPISARAAPSPAIEQERASFMLCFRSNILVPEQKTVRVLAEEMYPLTTNQHRSRPSPSS